MTIAEEIGVFESRSRIGTNPIRQQLTIELCDIREVLCLAQAISVSLGETAREFKIAIEKHYSSSALGDAVSFRLQRDLLLSLKRIYEEETGKSAEETDCFHFPE